MFRNIVFSALAQASPCASVVTALQFATTEPLILQAEEFEGGAPHDHAATAAPHDHGTGVAADRTTPRRPSPRAKPPSRRNGRRPTASSATLYTVVANLLVGVASR